VVVENGSVISLWQNQSNVWKPTVP